MGRAALGASSAAGLAAGVMAVALLALPSTAMPEQTRVDEAQCVRVAGRHTNVHMGPSSGQPVLVLAPQGTNLRIADRRGEWLGVELRPELRETGMVMRWYRNENRGYVHQSTVEAASCDQARPSS